MWNSLISLVKTENIQNENNFTEEKTVYIKKDIAAKKTSVTQSEFYKALATNIKLDITFLIRKLEYEEENIVIYENKKFKIIRTYEKNDNIYLMCSKKVEE